MECGVTIICRLMPSLESAGLTRRAGAGPLGASAYNRTSHKARISFPDVGVRLRRLVNLLRYMEHGATLDQHSIAGVASMNTSLSKLWNSQISKR